MRGRPYGGTSRLSFDLRYDGRPPEARFANIPRVVEMPYEGAGIEAFHVKLGVRVTAGMSEVSGVACQILKALLLAAR